MWTVEAGNGAGARLKYLLCVGLAVALWATAPLPAGAQSLRELLQKPLIDLMGVLEQGRALQFDGSLQSFYPLANTGTITLIHGTTGFRASLKVGGIASETAFDSLSGRGWRSQHGAVFPLDTTDPRQFLQVSPTELASALMGGVRGVVGVVDCGSATLPDGQSARWLKLVPARGAPWDVYLDAQGRLMAWGYHATDSFRRRPTRFVAIPQEWREFGSVRLPAEVKLFEDERHTQTVRWQTVQTLPASALHTHLQAPAPAKPPVGLPVTVPLRFFQRVMFVDVRLNGREYSMLLDTGAGITVIDKPAAEALRLPPGESMNLLGISGQGESAVATLDSLQIGDVTLNGVQVAVTDLGIIRLLGGSSFGGIIGFNVLNRFRMTVDYHRRQLILEAPGGVLPRGVVMPARFPGATPQVEMEVEDIGRVPMLLDTGAAMTIVPVEASLQWQPARAGSLGMALGVGGLSGAPRAARAQTVRLGGEAVRDVLLMFASPAPRGAPVQILSEAGFGLLGNSVLRHFRLTIDYPMRTVVLRRMPKPASMGDSASAGIVLDLTADSARVLGVTPLSSAWEQGIERGDEVLAVDGRSTRGVPPSEVQKWLTGEEGTRVRIHLRRGDRRWEAQLELKPML